MHGIVRKFTDAFTLMHALFAWFFTCRDMHRTGSDPHPVTVTLNAPSVTLELGNSAAKVFSIYEDAGPRSHAGPGFPRSNGPAAQWRSSRRKMVALLRLGKAEFPNDKLIAEAETDEEMAGPEA